MELNTPQDYTEIAMRRKWWIIIPFVVLMMGSYGVYKKLPKMYKATTLILVQPQKLPTNYVNPTVTLSITDRLPTISQQILSRTILEQVINQLHLLENPADPLRLTKKVNSLRKAIKIEVNPGGRGRETTSTFAISFEDENPVNAARIVNKIASVSIAENLKEREEQAHDTSQLFEKQLSEVEKRLKEKQVAIRRFKEQYMGELPDQQDANLRILERLQRELQTDNQSLIAAQQRKANLELQIDQTRTAIAQRAADQTLVTGDPLLTQLNDQRRRLQELQTQYTDEHPDVIATKASIERLEAQLRERKFMTGQESKEATPILDPTLDRLNQELQEVIDRIDRSNAEQANLKDRIAIYQRRIENAPKREEQISILLRDYNHLQETYQSLLDKKIQAQLAENLEKRQKRDQFKILDPALPPMNPFKPNRKQFFGLAVILGLGLGGCLAFVREHTDRSFHKADDVERFLGLPVIATLPRIETRRSNGK